MYAIILFPNDMTFPPKYLRRDEDFGFRFCDGTLADAHLFATPEVADKVYNDILSAKPVASTDGTIYPPTVLHGGLDISHKMPNASGVITIQSVTTKCVRSEPVKGEIKYPKGFVYE